MTNYTKDIEALDKKWGRPVTKDDWGRISEKAVTDLTDDDFTVLGYFAGPTRVAEARARQAAALVPPSAPSAPVTKAAPALTRKTIRKYFLKYSDVIFPMLTANFSKQKTRIEALEQRITALESRPLLKYAGIHVEGQAYQEAQLVTRSGGLWVSTAPTFTTPGTEGSAWRLVVKRGQA